MTINTGAGNDSVQNDGDKVTINTGAGNDYVRNDSSSVTITGGTGNDTIYNNWNFSSNAPYAYDNGANVLFKYTSGDGNDIIYGFKADSTLSIGGGSYSSKKSGDDVIVTVGNGKITLDGAANLDKVNIKFKKTSTETNTWKLSGTTASYGNLVTVSGVKAISGLSISGNVVTVSNSALNNAKVTISDGYTLKLASDVSKTSTKKAWSLSGTTAKYNQTTTAGYKLASDSKSISYSKATTKTLTTITGVKSTDGLSVSGNVVTVSNSALNKKKITISDGYTLKLASDVTKTSTKKSWSLSGTTATYKQTTTAGYKLSNNVITYTKKATKTLATVAGVKSKSGFKLDGKTIKLATSSLSKKVSVSGDYAFEFSSDYKNAKITGSSSADTIKVAGANMTITGGAGNDSIVSKGKNSVITGGKGKDTLTGGKGADIFVYSNGDGNDIITNYDENDKISLKSGVDEISTSGNNVIFTVGTGKITLKNANGKNITYIENGYENVYSDSNDTVKYNSAGTGATLTAKYSKDSFAPSGIYKDILVTIDASAVTNELIITGNKKANRIVGSEENDTIKGGNAKDTIKGGDGNDKIYGEKGNDSLIGGAGDDSLWGGADSDILIGGAGNDIFYYSSGDGNDTITDYSPGIDAVVILSPNVAIGNPTANKSGDVTFKVGNGQICFQKSANKYIELVTEGGNVLMKYNPR